MLVLLTILWHNVLWKLDRAASHHSPAAPRLARASECSFGRVLLGKPAPPLLGLAHPPIPKDKVFGGSAKGASGIWHEQHRQRRSFTNDYTSDTKECFGRVCMRQRLRQLAQQALGDGSVAGEPLGRKWSLTT